MTEFFYDDDVQGEAQLPADGRLMYRVSEAAEMLGIGRTNVYELMNEGRVRSVRIGHRRLIPRVALEAFVTELLEAS
jgi:excisionase family DNA binding protein